MLSFSASANLAYPTSGSLDISSQEVRLHSCFVTLFNSQPRFLGKVAENANISSAVHPAWRTAKTHLILSAKWDDSASLAEINQTSHFFQNVQRPILEELSGPNAGSYSNEADVLEPAFQTTFFGPNYAKLSAIKQKYDPDDLFLVGTGASGGMSGIYAECEPDGSLTYPTFVWFEPGNATCPITYHSLGQGRY
ncbi:hypothetical protein C8R45DRAFT_909856 [Mycena sanguinolenta]|nr:hypothetical protein C8R45DRAFT_909856 [Mycena sanguinolenta]